MIGNDIIDLNYAKTNSRWQEQRFLDKVFSEEEQTFIMANDNRFQNIWYLWSMKESAYKIYARHSNKSSFNPKFFRCKINSDTTGVVSFAGYKLNTFTYYNEDVLYTTATFQNDLRFSDYCLLKGKSHFEKSNQLKEKAILTFATIKSISKAAVTIQKKSSGVPYFVIDNQEQSNALTLSHHGRFGGFAISY